MPMAVWVAPKMLVSPSKPLILEKFLQNLLGSVSFHLFALFSSANAGEYLLINYETGDSPLINLMHELEEKMHRVHLLM